MLARARGTRLVPTLAPLPTTLASLPVVALACALTTTDVGANPGPVDSPLARRTPGTRGAITFSPPGAARRIVARNTSNGGAVTGCAAAATRREVGPAGQPASWSGAPGKRR